MAGVMDQFLEEAFAEDLEVTFQSIVTWVVTRVRGVLHPAVTILEERRSAESNQITQKHYLHAEASTACHEDDTADEAVANGDIASLENTSSRNSSDFSYLPEYQQLSLSASSHSELGCDAVLSNVPDVIDSSTMELITKHNIFLNVVRIGLTQLSEEIIHNTLKRIMTDMLDNFSLVADSSYFATKTSSVGGCPKVTSEKADKVNTEACISSLEVSHVANDIGELIFTKLESAVMKTYIKPASKEHREKYKGAVEMAHSADYEQAKEVQKTRSTPLRLSFTSGILNELVHTVSDKLESFAICKKKVFSEAQMSGRTKSPIENILQQSYTTNKERCRETTYFASRSEIKSHDQSVDFHYSSVREDIKRKQIEGYAKEVIKAILQGAQYEMEQIISRCSFLHKNIVVVDVVKGLLDSFFEVYETDTPTSARTYADLPIGIQTSSLDYFSRKKRLETIKRSDAPKQHVSHGGRITSMNMSEDQFMKQCKTITSPKRENLKMKRSKIRSASLRSSANDLFENKKLTLGAARENCSYKVLSPAKLNAVSEKVANALLRSIEFIGDEASQDLMPMEHSCSNLGQDDLVALTDSCHKSDISVLSDNKLTELIKHPDQLELGSAPKTFSPENRYVDRPSSKLSKEYVLDLEISSSLKKTTDPQGVTFCTCHIDLKRQFTIHISNVCQLNRLKYNISNSMITQVCNIIAEAFIPKKTVCGRMNPVESDASPYCDRVNSPNLKLDPVPQHPGHKTSTNELKLSQWSHSSIYLFNAVPEILVRKLLERCLISNYNSTKSVCDDPSPHKAEKISDSNELFAGRNPSSYEKNITITVEPFEAPPVLSPFGHVTQLTSKPVGSIPSSPPTDESALNTISRALVTSVKDVLYQNSEKAIFTPWSSVKYPSESTLTPCARSVHKEEKQNTCSEVFIRLNDNGTESLSPVYLEGDLMPATYDKRGRTTRLQDTLLSVAARLDDVINKLLHNIFPSSSKINTLSVTQSHFQEMAKQLRYRALNAISNTTFWDENNSNVKQFLHAQIDIQQVVESVYNHILQEYETIQALQAALAINNQTVIGEIANIIVNEMTRHLQTLLPDKTAPLAENIVDDVLCKLKNDNLHSPDGQSPAVYSADFLENIIAELVSKVILNPNTIGVKHEQTSDSDLIETAVKLVHCMIGKMRKYDIKVIRVNEETEDHLQHNTADVKKVVDSVYCQVLKEYGCPEAAQKAINTNGNILAKLLTHLLLAVIPDYQIQPCLMLKQMTSRFTIVEAANVLSTVKQNITYRQHARHSLPRQNLLSSEVFEDIIGGVIHKIFPSSGNVNKDPGDPSSFSDSELKAIISKLVVDVMREISEQNICSIDAKDIEDVHSEKNVPDVVDSVYSNIVDTYGSPLAIQERITNRSNALVKAMSRFVFREISNPNFMAGSSTDSSVARAVDRILCGLDDSQDRSQATDHRGVYSSFLEEIISEILLKIFFTCSDQIIQKKDEKRWEVELQELVAKLVNSVLMEIKNSQIKVSYSCLERQGHVVDTIVNSVFSKIFQDYETNVALYASLTSGTSLFAEKLIYLMEDYIFNHQIESHVTEDVSLFTYSTLDAKNIVPNIVTSIMEAIGHAASSMSHHPEYSARRVHAASSGETRTDDTTQTQCERQILQPSSRVLSSAVLEEIVVQFLSTLFYNCPNVSLDEDPILTISQVKSITEVIVNALLVTVSEKKIQISHHSCKSHHVHPKDTLIVRKVVDAVYSNVYELCGQSPPALYERLSQNRGTLALTVASCMITEICHRPLQPCHSNGKLCACVGMDTHYIAETVMELIKHVLPQSEPLPKIIHQIQTELLKTNPSSSTPTEPLKPLETGQRLSGKYTTSMRVSATKAAERTAKQLTRTPAVNRPHHEAQAQQSRTKPQTRPPAAAKPLAAAALPSTTTSKRLSEMVAARKPLVEKIQCQVPAQQAQQPHTTLQWGSTNHQTRPPVAAKPYASAGLPSATTSKRLSETVAARKPVVKRPQSQAPAQQAEQPHTTLQRGNTRQKTQPPAASKPYAAAGLPSATTSKRLSETVAARKPVVKRPQSQAPAQQAEQPHTTLQRGNTSEKRQPPAASEPHAATTLPSTTTNKRLSEMVAATKPVVKRPQCQVPAQQSQQPHDTLQRGSTRQKTRPSISAKPHATTSKRLSEMVAARKPVVKRPQCQSPAQQAQQSHTTLQHGSTRHHAPVAAKPHAAAALPGSTTNKQLSETVAARKLMVEKPQSQVPAQQAQQPHDTLQQGSTRQKTRPSVSAKCRPNVKEAGANQTPNDFPVEPAERRPLWRRLSASLAKLVCLKKTPESF